MTTNNQNSIKIGDDVEDGPSPPSAPSTNVEHRQGGVYSCGSAALLCAAIELGVPTISSSFGGPKRFDDPYDHKYEYGYGTITAINRLNERGLYKHAKATYGRGGKVGMCYPDGLIRTAKVLGLDVTVYFEPSRGLRCLTGRCGIWDCGLIQNQLDWCEDNGITVVHQKYDLQSAGPNDRIMKCLSPLHCLSLHWVMIRPDGTVMDPHKGRNYDTLVKIKRMFFYNGTGLTLVFRRKAEKKKHDERPHIMFTSTSSSTTDDTSLSPTSSTDSD
mmetsp:Transcript_47822/g.116384  ORF Transcript_47822/g.116384 Transcript_47822/m.116384 type:complete len:273 (+) Transcript_47822:10-828(+)